MFGLFFRRRWPCSRRRNGHDCRRRFAVEALEDRLLLSVVLADFNNDAFMDMAVGVPGEDLGAGDIDAGAVNVIYGTPDGLDATGERQWLAPVSDVFFQQDIVLRRGLDDQLWSQNVAGISGVSESGDRFGEALAAGDFNGDGYQDLAIGVPGEDFSGVPNAGVVQVLYGSASGLGADGSQIWHQNSRGILGIIEAYDEFGSVLAVGDFNGDHRDDLAIGVPGENLGQPDDNLGVKNTNFGPISNAGVVHVLYGSDDGLEADGNQLWSQDNDGTDEDEGPEYYDDFGAALVAGDFDGNGADDLAIGAPGEDARNDSTYVVIGKDEDTGIVHVLYGQPDAGLQSDDSQVWFQGAAPAGQIRGARESWDYFGAALAAGDFRGDDDGTDDLAIGVPGEDIGNVVDAGAVNVIFGSANRLTASGDQVIYQGYRQMQGVPGSYDLFGAALAAADLNVDGRDDLVIGAPGEDVGTANEAGIVQIAFGTGSGFSDPIASLSYDLDYAPEIDDSPWPEDHYGASVAAAVEVHPSGPLGPKTLRPVLAIAAPSQSDVNNGGIRPGLVHVVTGDVVDATPETHQVFQQGKADVKGAAEAGDLFGGAPNTVLLTGVPIPWEPGAPNRGVIDLRLASSLSADGIPNGSEVLSDFPAFQSKPDAPVHLFLDFDGVWTNFRLDIPRTNDPGDFVLTPVFDMDESTRSEPDGGVAGYSAFQHEVSFNRTEREVIQDVWLSMAEDFAPFNINVTTVKPDDAPFDSVYRVAFGGWQADRRGDPRDPTNTAPGGQWPGTDWRGEGGNNTGYVFADAKEETISKRWYSWGPLGRLAHNASHEAGHGIGRFRHKGDFPDPAGSEANKVREYSKGGAAWSPLMGSATQDGRGIWTEPRIVVPATEHEDSAQRYVRAVTKDGEDSNAEPAWQDEPAMLAREFGLRPDDHPNGATNLGQLSIGSEITATGLISTTQDTDSFEFLVQEDGLLWIRLDVNELAPNLDSTLRLEDAQGQLIADLSSPGLGNSMALAASAGVYTVTVGSRDRFNGDLGQYTLRLSLLANLNGTLNSFEEAAAVGFDDAIAPVSRPPRSDDGNPLTLDYFDPFSQQSRHYLPEQLGSIHGQIWVDLDTDGQRSSNEDGADGVLVELIDLAGRVLDRTTTTSLDLNTDGNIDPRTEKGLYSFEEVPSELPLVVRQGADAGRIFPNPSTTPLGYMAWVEPGGSLGVAPGAAPQVPLNSLSSLSLAENTTASFFSQAIIGIDWDLDGLEDIAVTVAGQTEIRNGQVTSNGFQQATLPTEIVSMRLVGLLPPADTTDTGVNGTLLPRVATLTERNDRTSFGGVHGQVPQGKFEPVFSSSFDTYFELEILDPNAGTAAPARQTLTADIPVPLEATNVTVLPPFDAEFRFNPISSTEVIPLLDNNGQTRAQIVSVEYLPQFGADFGRLPGDVQLDFGDASQNLLTLVGYPTLLVTDGARHVLTSDGPILGQQIDGELDGQPAASADGDDTGPDDEDGVTFGPLRTGQETRLSVEVRRAAGVLNAWIDFNQDGDWSDDDEQIFTDQPVIQGFQELLFDVPTGALVGDTYARFRVSSSGNLSPSGLAFDGEAEDYVVSIADGRQTDAIGVYYAGAWSLDLNRTDTRDLSTEDNVWSFGGPGETPVVGDWNGDGVDDPGTYSADGTWRLDLNGDGIPNDAPFTFHVTGVTGLTPVTGDWNGDGTDDVGLYAVGYWLRDINGDRSLDSTDSSSLAVYGASGLTPVVGDWNGDGDDDLGVYAPSGSIAGAWALDADENNTLDFPADIVAFGFGFPNLTPVVGDWNNDGADDVGVYASETAFGGTLTGSWVLDANDNGVLDDDIKGFGAAGDTPLVGNWPVPAPIRLASPAFDPGRSTTARLTQTELQSIVETAIALWADAGVSDDDVALLSRVTVSVADLSGSILAITSPLRIVIDTDAAGYGWFVDPTPLQNEEFAVGGDGGELEALGEAGSQADLLTVVAHELGHELGLRHDSGTSVMDGELPLGVRRPVEADLIDAAFSSGWDDYLLQ